MKNETKKMQMIKQGKRNEKKCLKFNPNSSKSIAFVITGNSALLRTDFVLLRENFPPLMPNVALLKILDCVFDFQNGIYLHTPLNMLPKPHMQQNCFLKQRRFIAESNFVATITTYIIANGQLNSIAI